MTNNDLLDRKAIAEARPYMGKVAWPTILIGLALVTAYLATVSLALLGVISLWLAVPLLAVMTYLSYTVLHESVHGSISGNNSSMRWVNKAMGYVAGWIVLIPFTVHRHQHMAHHRHANDAEHDPDFHVSEMSSSLLAPIRVVLTAASDQYRYYAKNHWARATTQEKFTLCLEVMAALIPRLAVTGSGFLVEGLAMFVLAWLIGAIVLLYLFAYIVHRPHAQEGRYIDTSTILLPRSLSRLVTWLWMFQNYHSIHHLFPRVPFYKAAELFEKIEDVMAAKGAPIYRISLQGLKVSTPTLANQE